ncbi:hypothetical protein BDR03DRAFT_968740 [Suillus americanus]|nr:hypothetical protein BDR03DRAFT_968740 [Suillus americanus]
MPWTLRYRRDIFDHARLGPHPEPTMPRGVESPVNWFLTSATISVSQYRSTDLAPLAVKCV